ncbi:class I SAM-dependent methyltransferase [Lactococcus piscium]|uniref:Ubiquinone/menaquinone biosynthesis methyltransferase n=1 Tax=Pseudolactococcus piscium MKFS47 TaxID=297352 RepID=A0A0D6DYV6_9LACT|nr:class I SAM-dependent methyltransferase [Lactococcus piscium]CEN28973.1 Ubiquinone/menaquinone biosynthesis methyltransferase [Lactococcus piscium MKFS47]
MVDKEIGHNFLARIGKKRLRPRGVNATRWLIDKGAFSEQTRVLEVACNMCTTSIELAKKFNCNIVGIDLDTKALEKAKINIRKANLENRIEVIQGNALKLPFADNSFDIVINEAMLTMLSPKAKKKAISEYYRVLKPGGKLLTHDVAYLNPQLEQIILELRKTININVSPLSVADWESVFKQSGFSSVESTNGEMTLMSLKGMIKDEGLLNTLNIIKNGHKRENKEMFQNMHTFFTKTGKELKYIAVCSQK